MPRSTLRRRVDQTGMPIPGTDKLDLRPYELHGLIPKAALAYHKEVYEKALGETTGERGDAREEQYYALCEKTTIAQRLEAFDWVNSKDYGVVPFKMWENQVDLLKHINECYQENRPCEILVLKARQRGCSTLIQLVMKDLLFQNEHWKGLTISHEVKSTRNIARIASFSWEKMIYRPRAEFHVGAPSIFSNGAIMELETAQADAPGRSYTYKLIHLSEAAWFMNDYSTIAGVMDTLPETGFYLVIQETTANGQGNQFYDVWTAAERGENAYLPVFQGWFHEPRYQREVTKDQEKKIMRTLDEEERRGIADYGWTPQQLAWRRHRIDTRYSGNIDLFHQEMPSNPDESFLVSGRMVFDRKAMMIVRKNLNTIRPAFQGDILERSQVG